MIVMGGASQRDWLHGVPRADTPNPRISLTWRWTSRRGRPDTNPTYYEGRQYSDRPRQPGSRPRGPKVRASGRDRPGKRDDPSPETDPAQIEEPGQRVGDAEGGEAGGGGGDVGVGGVGRQAVEEPPDLPCPRLQVRPQDRRLVGVGELDGVERLDAAADAQRAGAGGRAGCGPTGSRRGRDEVARAVDGEQVDRRAAELAGRAAAHLEDARALDADAAPGEAGDERVEDLPGEAVGDEVAGGGGGGHGRSFVVVSSALDVDQ